MGTGLVSQVEYEVREIRDGDPPLDLGLRFTTGDYFDAVDFACEFLEEQDPFCDGSVSALEVVKVQDGERTTVLTYRHSLAANLSKDLAGVWGFDVTLPWRGPGGADTDANTGSTGRRRRPLAAPPRTFRGPALR
jgi:hypothetical protein